MKQCLYFNKTLLLFIMFLSFINWGYAQDKEKTLVDEQTNISFYSVDKQIDIGFTPTSNFIQSIIFYSFKVKNQQSFFEVKPKSSFSYYIKADSSSYHQSKAKGKSGFIAADGGKTYYISTDSATFASKAEGEKLKESKSKKSYIDLDKAPYKIQTKLADGTEFKIQYKDAQNCLLSYQETDQDGNVYNVTQTVAFGKQLKIKDHDFTIFVADDAKLSADTPVYAFKAGKISLPFVLVVLLLGALFFTIYFKFPNITRLKLAIDTVRGRYVDADEDEAQEDNPDTIRDESVEGEVTPFQALSAALSATVGLGNIAGVAIAITIGGPGATFWMIIAGLLGMASKFTECTLGVKYREIGPDGQIHGGPMYYLSKGLAARGMAGLGKVFAIFFAIMCVGGSFGGGNMFQANQAAVQVLDTFNINAGLGGFIFGLIIMVLVAVVIIGGIKRIGKVAETIVPLMAVLYVGAALIILGVNVTAIPTAFGAIFEGAFNPSAAFGGIVGVLIAGFQRAAFSNEAGVGSAAIAHSAVRTKYPASEGVVALLEPFIDTVIICTMTALVIIVTGNHLNEDGLDGVGLTSSAFSTVIPGFEYILTIAVVLFAFSTMLSWSYYGLQAWKFLFGKGRVADLVYKILFCIFIVIGASASLGAVVGFSDAMIFAMVFPNIIGLILLAPVVRKEVKRYVDFTKNFRNKESKA